MRQATSTPSGFPKKDRGDTENKPRQEHKIRAATQDAERAWNEVHPKNLHDIRKQELIAKERFNFQKVPLRGKPKREPAQKALT